MKKGNPVDNFSYDCLSVTRICPRIPTFQDYCLCLILFSLWNLIHPQAFIINCGSIIWREHVSIGSGITFLSFAIFFLYLFMRSFLIIILLFLNGIGFQSIIGATTVCYFLNLWNYKRRWMLRPLGRNCRRTLSLIQHHSLEIY